MNHEFSVKFRQELATKSLESILLELVVSKSEKVPLKKQYLTRECAKKKAFKAQIKDACRSLLPNIHTREKLLIIALHQELTGQSL